MPDPLPIAVLVSGSGTNLEALIRRQRSSECQYRIVVVLSDRDDAGGLARARDAGIAAEHVGWGPSRHESTVRVCDMAERYGAEALILAGFMRILAPEAIARFPDSIINVHPALLPSFPGANAVEQALDHGVTVTGVTVHFVDEQVDHGPIVSQEAVLVSPDDDVATLHERIQGVEHRLLPDAVEALAQGRLSVTGRVVEWAEPPATVPG